VVPQFHKKILIRNSYEYTLYVFFYHGLLIFELKSIYINITFWISYYISIYLIFKIETFDVAQLFSNLKSSFIIAILYSMQWYIQYFDGSWIFDTNKLNLLNVYFEIIYTRFLISLSKSSEPRCSCGRRISLVRHDTQTYVFGHFRKHFQPQ